MKTAVTSTSIDAYRAIHREGHLTRQQSQIMGCIYAGRDYSLQELVSITGLPVNVMSARCNELRAAKRLEHGNTRACSLTGRKVHPVRLPAGQVGLFQ